MTNTTEATANEATKTKKVKAAKKATTQVAKKAADKEAPKKATKKKAAKPLSIEKQVEKHLANLAAPPTGEEEFDSTPTLDFERADPSDADTTAKSIGVKLIATPPEPEEGSRIDVPQNNGEDETPIEVPNSKKNMLLMHKPWCFRCSHLVASSPKQQKHLKAFSDCHYLNGNEACPAKNNRLVLGADTDQLAEQLYIAFTRGDAEAELKLRTKIIGYDPVIQNLVNLKFAERIRNTPSA